MGRSTTSMCLLNGIRSEILENSASLLSNSDQQLSQCPKALSDLESISPTTGKSPDVKSEQEVTHVDDIKATTDSAGILEQDQISLAPSATNQVE